MKLLHLSDIHFIAFTFNPLRLLSKRALGMGNALVNRRHHYSQEQLRVILDKVNTVDQVWITGDLTTTAMEEEFALARHFLQKIVDQQKEILLIPGNHDRYTTQSRQDKTYETELHAYLKERDCFPFVQHLQENIVLIGLDATDPIDWLSAAGRVPEEQYQKLEEILSDPTIQNKRIIVLCHYPMVYPEGFHEAESHKLVERERLCSLLTRYGVGLYLHGHTHHQWILPPTSTQPLIINAGSATKKKLGGHILLEIKPEVIKIDPYLHFPQEGWKAQPSQEFPFLPAKERRIL